MRSRLPIGRFSDQSGLTKIKIPILVFILECNLRQTEIPIVAGSGQAPEPIGVTHGQAGPAL